MSQSDRRSCDSEVVRQIAGQNLGGRDVSSPVVRSAGENGRVLARGELSLGRADLSQGQSPARDPAPAGTHQAAAARALGHHRRTQFHLRAPEPADQGVRPEHDLRHRPRPRRSGAGGAQLPGGGRTPSAIRASSAAATGCNGYFDSSPGLTAFPATSRRKRPARSTKAASSVTACCMHSARLSTIRT
jgi:hypothetical protein